MQCETAHAFWVVSGVLSGLDTIAYPISCGLADESPGGYPHAVAVQCLRGVLCFVLCVGQRGLLLGAEEASPLRDNTPYHRHFSLLGIMVHLCIATNFWRTTPKGARANVNADRGGTSTLTHALDAFHCLGFPVCSREIPPHDTYPGLRNNRKASVSGCLGGGSVPNHAEPRPS